MQSRSANSSTTSTQTTVNDPQLTATVHNWHRFPPRCTPRAQRQIYICRARTYRGGCSEDLTLRTQGFRRPGFGRPHPQTGYSQGVRVSRQDLARACAGRGEGRRKCRATRGPYLSRAPTHTNAPTHTHERTHTQSTRTLTTHIIHPRAGASYDVRMPRNHG